MYNNLFGFSQKPFEVAPDPKFLYLTSSHREALNAMMEGIKTRQGFISVTGEVGTGKTTLIHSLLMSLDTRVKTAFIFHTLVTIEELLESILRELYIKATRKDKATLLRQLAEYLWHLGEDETVAVIIDEAQHLSALILQELAELPQLAPLASKRLQIYFVGQPEFDTILTSPGLKILNQLIEIKRTIKILTVEESRDYIEHRLKIVGSSTGDIFTFQAVSDIIKYAKGIPRVINIVCDNALLGGFSESRKIIDAKIIRDVIKNLEGPALPAGKQLKDGRITSFFKRFSPVRGERILTLRQIAFILLLLSGLGAIVFAAHGFLRSGSSERQSIESIWTSIFHDERPLATLPHEAKTGALNVDVQNAPAGEGASSAESPQPVVRLPATSARMSGDTQAMETIIVKKGQSITRLAADHYRMSNTTSVALILDYNPGITNANFIAEKQKVRMPKITEESLIISSSDRTFKINVGTFGGPEFARIYKAEPSLKGKEVEVIPRKVGPKSNWYRVVVGNFDSENEALKVISVLREKNLLPIFGAFPKLK